MAVENLAFQGINRAITDFASARACEELINLRPTGSGIVPVRPFKAIAENKGYGKVFVHNVGRLRNIIGILTTSSGGSLSMGVYLLDEDGDIGATIDTFTIDDIISMDCVHFAAAGNMCLLSIYDPDATALVDEGLFLNKAYLWDGTQYVERQADIPSLTMTVSPAESDTDVTTVKSAEVLYSMRRNADPVEWEKAARNAFDEIQAKNPDLCFGVVMIAIAFKTADGETFWTQKWTVFDPTPHFKYNQRPPSQFLPNYNTYINGGLSSDFPEFLANHSDGYVVYSYYAQPDDECDVLFQGVPLSVKLQMPSGSWDRETSLIKSVEIYASRPVLYVDPSDHEHVVEVFDEGSGPLEGLVNYYAIPPVKRADLKLGDQLMYHAASVELERLNSGNAVTVQLSFGASAQQTESVLEVDAGQTYRFGKVLSYNSRFHFYASVAARELGMPAFLIREGNTTQRADIFVRYSGERNELHYLGYLTMRVDTAAIFVTASDARIIEVITYWKDPNYQTRYLKRFYPMEPSARYNYSVFTKSARTEQGGADAELEALIYAGVKNEVITDEHSAINVSEQYNPFVFDVSHSYLAPGAVLDVQPQMAQETQSQYGTYPLNVFTSRGLYALMQGEGEVLYRAFEPISDLVSGSNSAPTEMGTFFLGSGSLWLVSGRHVTLISDALSQGPHKYIRDCQGFKSLSMGWIVGTYSAEPYLSDLPFEQYIDGPNGKATLSYNRKRQELFISNPNYEYTYVISLKYRQWFKITQPISQEVVGGGIATVPNREGGTIHIIDLETEFGTSSVLVHYQSRPFTFATQYSHLHRIVQLVRAALGSTDLFIPAVYGSDDLQTWHLLSYAKRKAASAGSTLKISQVRTAPAARSWRYYTVCAGGIVPPDTDIGPVLIDYEPVTRRIG